MSQKWDELNYLKNEKKDFGSLADKGKDEALRIIREHEITPEQFWDMIFRGVRRMCRFNIFDSDHSECTDVEGEELAYDLNNLKKLWNNPRLTCGEICKQGCCARENQLAYAILDELYEYIYEERKQALVPEPQVSEVDERLPE